MQWQRAQFRGKSVWASIDGPGSLSQEGGRVAIRYSASAGSKVYRAGAASITLDGTGEIRELPDGVSADSAKSSGGRGQASGFGSAKTRTQAQKAMAVDAAKQLLASLPKEAVVGYTDGSCRGNPGPAGAGALVVLPDGRRGESCADLGHATNNVAELTAIELALGLLDEVELAGDHPVALLSDSSYVNGVLCKGWKAKKNTELIMALRESLGRRPGVTVYWVAGHAGIEGNERADTLANQGAAGLTTTRWE